MALVLVWAGLVRLAEASVVVVAAIVPECGGYLEAWSYQHGGRLQAPSLSPAPPLPAK